MQKVGFTGKIQAVIALQKNFTPWRPIKLWKLRNFTATVFLQIFRQINVLLLHSVEKYAKMLSHSKIC